MLMIERANVMTRCFPQNRQQPRIESVREIGQDLIIAGCSPCSTDFGRLLDTRQRPLPRPDLLVNATGQKSTIHNQSLPGNK